MHVLYMSVLDAILAFKGINETESGLVWSPYISVKQILYDIKLEIYNIWYQNNFEITKLFKQINQLIFEQMIKLAWMILQFSKENKQNLIDEIVGTNKLTVSQFISEASSMNMYWKMNSESKDSEKKRPKRYFENKDKILFRDWSFWRYKIPAIDENELLFNKNNEDEVSQILTFGYKDSFFYDKIQNKWRNSEEVANDLKWQVDLNSEFWNSSI